MIIRARAYARAGLLGNPSDGYHGRTVSCIVRNFAAEVICYETPRLCIVPRRQDRSEFADLDALLDDVRLNGYYGGIRLIKAAIKKFADWCRAKNIGLGHRNFTIEYSTDIPVRVGLSGSSAIVTAAIRALMMFYRVNIPKPILPNLILSAEADELDIAAGMQDRVIQTYEGAVFMDFDKAHMARHGHGRYEPLDPALLPPLFIAYRTSLAKDSGRRHNDFRFRFQRGDPEALSAVAEWADLASRGAELIRAGRSAGIGPLMDRNFDIRDRMFALPDDDRRMVGLARGLGCPAKFAGSGGAVVGMYDGRPETFDALVRAYEGFARVIRPWVAEADERSGRGGLAAAADEDDQQ